MRNLIFLMIIFSCLTSCSKDDESAMSATLKSEIINLQEEIRIISNELEGYSLQGRDYSDDVMILGIADFTDKRTLQNTKEKTLFDMYNEVVEYETITCGDFESMGCFVENWDVQKQDDATIEVSSNCSYNGTSSLILSAPFIEGEHNIPGISIEGFINGIEASTIYKVRYWLKYSGTSDLSNGPLTSMVVIQDGEWLDNLYEGFHDMNENRVVDKDWKLYSFQIATLSDSPLEIRFWTNLDNVCIDDVHIVKKDQ